MDKQRYFDAGNVFTPNAPVQDEHLFSGRKDQIKSLIRALAARGSHAIIFGERGVGKTSLGNIIKTHLPDGVLIAVVSCDSDMTYSTLWRSILERLSVAIPKEQAIGFGNGEKSETGSLNLLDLIENKKNISSQDVRSVLEKVDGHIIIFIDEIDRLDGKTTMAMADTVKTFSDYSLGAKLVLIGVGKSVGELIQGHQSIERALVQIQMPRMSPSEIDGIITSGLESLGMTIEKTVRNKVVALSRGLPHYTHLIMLHSSQHAAEDDRTNIDQKDFAVAVRESVQEKGQSLRDEYNVAIQSTRKAYLFPYVLTACALAKGDSDGYFALTDIQRPLEKLRGEKIVLAAFIKHVGAFCSEERGGILEKTGKEHKYRYRFRNPLMQSYVIMRAISDDLQSNTPIEDLL